MFKGKPIDIEFLEYHQQQIVRLLKEGKCTKETITPYILMEQGILLELCGCHPQPEQFGIEIKNESQK